MVCPSRIGITGSLAAHRDDFWVDLLAQGYTPLSSVNLLRLLAHLSRWLDQNDLQPNGLSDEQITQFLHHRRKEGYTSHLSPSGLQPVISYLRRAQVIPPAATAPRPQTELDEGLHQYEDYLVQERGVCGETVERYRRVARRFLSARFGTKNPALDRLVAADVTAFVLDVSRSSTVGTAKSTVTALRSFLRFLYLQGKLSSDLSGAVPALAGWRLQGLPKGLAPQEVKKLLGSCDRRKHVGRRDYAVLLLMVRLGLRACEVARLTLDDIDWHHGQLTVHGKADHQAYLPLTQEVGEAVASYLHRSRPCCEFRAVFATVRAPVRPLSRRAVIAIPQNIRKRTGLPVSAHALRHTAATQMLRNGASLSDIAQVLRHQSLDTTVIYAKVDDRALRAVCRPWPGGTS